MILLLLNLLILLVPALGLPNVGDSFHGAYIHTGPTCMHMQGERVNGARVVTQKCNWTSAQRWTFRYGVPTQIRFEDSRHSNLCLDAGLDPTNYVQLKVWECFSVPQQTFVVDGQNIYLEKEYALEGRNVHFALDRRRGKTYNGNPIQLWELLTWNPNQWWDINGTANAD